MQDRTKALGAGALIGLGLYARGARGDDSDDTDDPNVVTIDMESGSVDDDFYVNDVRGDHYPEYVSDRASEGNRSLYQDFTAQKTANVEYRFPENGRGNPDEIYVSFDLYPTGFDLRQGDTVRFMWLPLARGARSSGVDGAPDGTNGWSNNIGFARRGSSEPPHPEGYNFFSYAYHMDQPQESGELEPTDAVIWQGQWNTIEGYIKANSHQNGYANRDGIMRFWVNDELAYERTDLAFTTTDENLIDSIGPNGYLYSTHGWHGGLLTGSLYHDNLTIDLDPNP